MIARRVRRWGGRAVIVLLASVVTVLSVGVPAQAAPAIGGAIRTEYIARGGFATFGDAYDVEKPSLADGRFQVFQRGNNSIYWHNTRTGGKANQIGGLIFTKWASLNHERGVLGYPITEERAGRKPGGRYNRFENGGIYWAGGAEAYVVLGGSQIEQTWKANDWEFGSYGYPTSNEFDFEGGKRQNFQNGYIEWKPDGYPVDWQGDEDQTDTTPDCGATNSSCGFDARGVSMPQAGQTLNVNTRPNGASRMAPQTGPPSTCPTDIQPAPTTPQGPSTSAPTPPPSQAPSPAPNVTERTVSPPSEPSVASSAPAPGRTPASTETNVPTPASETTLPTSQTPAPPSSSSAVSTPSVTPQTEQPQQQLVWCRREGPLQTAPSNRRSATTPPQMCEENQGTWKGSRQQACYLSRSAEFVLKDPSNANVEVGKFNGIEYIMVKPDWKSSTWFVEYSFQITSTEQNAEGAQITVSQSCDRGGTSCGIGDSNTFTVTEGTDLAATSSFETPPPAGGIVTVQPITRLSIIAEDSVPYIEQVGAAPVRCDAKPRMRGTIGCVTANVSPIWDIRGYSNLDKYREHVAFAVSSGLPGFADNAGGGDPLTRITDANQIKLRRSITCGGVTGPRTSGRSCDEYPMASTYQGGNNGDRANSSGTGRTGPQPMCGIRDADIKELANPNPLNWGTNGYSVCLIDASQNSRAGSLQGWFYTKARVIDGDTFLVRP